MLSATPMDMPPPPPRSVEVVVIDGSTFQLLVLPPQRDGGRNITRFDVDVDTDLSFQVEQTSLYF